MESDSGSLQENGFHFNGLLPNRTASLTRVLGVERWTRAEERAAELIARIQPDQTSWQTRNAVASYVKRLITETIPCVVFIYGSVPLKTYLPDGDIDLTVFSEDRNLKDNCAAKVSKILEKAGTDADAEHEIKEVQLIPAEVKVVKCLVDDIVVDISFGQLGGLCTLCFLEEADQLINQNHLFKRSILLIKAWCYYESRLLGAYHGLLSTYALETLILYIFHVFNNSFAGPLEVLYRFLEFFSSFDWDNFSISLQGPVPIRSLPAMTANPPRKDGGALFLSERFLDACQLFYSVSPSTTESKESFCSKHLNIIDFLRISNNLGRSVSRGNFFRIRSALTFGAKRLAAVLNCPLENVVTEFDLFFVNTWEMNGRVLLRPDTHFVYTSGFVNLCHTEKGGELHDPAIIYADDSFTIDRPKRGRFCRKNIDRKQNLAIAQATACSNSEDRKQFELVIENGDLVGRCGGRREILCSSFTSSNLKPSNDPLDDRSWKDLKVDFKSVTDHTAQCKTPSCENVFEQFCRKVKGGGEEDKFWKTETSPLPAEALLTCPPKDFSFFTADRVPCPGTADRCFDILDGDLSRHLNNILCAQSYQITIPSPAKDISSSVLLSSSHYPNHWPLSSLKTDKCITWKLKGKNQKKREVDSKPQADAAARGFSRKVYSTQWIALGEKPSFTQAIQP